MRLKVFSTVMLLCGLHVVGFAQYSLSGTVKNKTAGEPIADAQVYIKEKNLLTTTDSKGEFSFEPLATGHYTIITFSFNYEKAQVEIELKEDRTLEFELEELNTELSEVVISQRKEEIFGLKRLQPVEGTAIYAGKKTEVVLVDQLVGNMAANNPRQVFSQVVGLNIYDTNDAGLQLSIGGRGLDPNRSANFNTRQNGYDISADVLGYPESYYTPPVEALEQIEVIRGAASLQYGTQFGGLVNFIMKSPVDDQPVQLISRQTVGSFGLLTSFNSLSGTIGKFSYYSYFNYKQGNGFRPNSDFDSKNFYGNYRFQITDKTRLSFDISYLHYLAKQPGGLTDAQFEIDPKFSNRTRNWFEVDWKLYSLKLQHRLSGRTEISLVLFALDAERNALGFRGIQGSAGMDRNPVSEDDHPNDAGTGFNYTRDLIKGDFNNVGLEGRYLTRYEVKGKPAAFLVGAKYYQAKNSSRQGPGSITEEPDFNFASGEHPDYPNWSSFEFPNFNLSIFGENVFYINDQLSVTPGFRLEYIKTESDGTYRSFPDPSDESVYITATDNRSLPRSFALLGMGLSQQFSNRLEIYGNVSQNYRSVTFSDIRVVNPTFVIDPDIKDEKGYTADLGLRGRFGDYASYDLGAFGLFYNDKIGTLLDDRANRVRGNVGDALIYGFEGFIDFNLVKIFDINEAQTRLKWFVNLALTDSKYLRAADGNSGVKGRKIEFIPYVNLKSGLNAGYKNFLVSGQFTFMSNQFSDAENSPVAEEGDLRDGIIGEIPSYHILDLSLSYVYKRFKIETGSNNALDNSYFTRRATGYPGPGIIPSDGRSFYLTLEVKI